MKLNFDKKLLTEIAEREPAQMKSWEQRVLAMYLWAQYQQTNGKINLPEFKRLPKSTRAMIRSEAQCAPARIVIHKRLVAAYFAKARAIQKKADKQAGQIWRRVVERNRDAT